MRGLTDDDKAPLLNRRFPPGLKVVAIVVVSLVLMAVDSSNNHLAPVRSSLAVALQPLQIIAEIPGDAID